jgi:hypothetical protein
MNDTASRRDFLKLAAGALAGSCAPGLLAAEPAREQKSEPFIFGNLLHLSYDMWSDRPVEKWGYLKPEDLGQVTASDHLRFEESLWKDLTQRMVQAGMNLLVIDLGDGVQYESHPEISVKGAWSIAKLKAELQRLRALGLEPIPKLNFSAAHDVWLGNYHRMVSTPTYYKVCQDLIEEVVRIFDQPRFFHLGYDEETASNQAQYAIAIIRQHELWWHDLNFFVQTVEKLGVRPWIWSDYAWSHSPEYYEKMPRSVMQSNWFYGPAFDNLKDPKISTYLDLEEHGFDQIPTGSNWASPLNFAAMVEFCRAHIAPSRLKGFLQTPWKPTWEKWRSVHFQAIEVAEQAMRKNESHR